MQELKRLIDLHGELGFPVARHYGRGLTPDAVEQLAKSHGKLIDPETQRMYLEANGTTADDAGCAMWELWIVPGYYMLSLDEALATQSYLLETDANWLPECLPIFASGGAVFLCVDGGGHVIRSDPEGGTNVQVISMSLSQFFSKIVRYVETGIIRKPDDGILEWASDPWP